MLDDLSDLSLNLGGEDEPMPPKLLPSDLSERSGKDEPMPFDPLPSVSKLPVKQYATIPAAIHTPKVRRGHRSKSYQAKQAKYREQMHEKNMKKKQELTVIATPTKWESFEHTQINGKEVIKKVKKVYGQTKDMPVCTEVHNILIRNPEHQDPTSSNSLIPPYCLARFDHIVSTECSRRAKSAYRKFLQSGPKHNGCPDKDKNRSTSKSPAFHLGTWMGQSLPTPCVSGESRVQKKEVIQAMDDFLGVIKKYLAPKIAAHMNEYFPVQYRRSMAVYKKLKAFPPVNDLYEKRPNLDFGGAFFMVAVKIGSSFTIHLDFTDDRNHPSWTVPLTRNYVGGKFHCPQTGMQIPILAGQAIAALTRIMPHAGTAVESGERLTVTLFSPGRLMEWGTRNNEDWQAEEVEIHQMWMAKEDGEDEEI